MRIISKSSYAAVAFLLVLAPALDAGVLQLSRFLSTSRIDVDQDGLYLDSDISGGMLGSTSPINDTVGTVNIVTSSTVIVREARIAMEFSLASLPVPYSSITSATLDIAVFSGGSPFTTVDLYLFQGSGDFEETDFTGGAFFQNVSTVGSPFASFTKSFDITSILQSAVGPYVGFGLRSADPNFSTGRSLTYYSDISGPVSDRRPLLTITYDDPVAPVPEPGTASLLGGVLGLMGLLRLGRGRLNILAARKHT